MVCAFNVILISFELKNTYVGIMPFLYPIYLWICVHIFCTNKYLLVACRATSASSSKYGLTSPIFNFITFPGKIAGNCFNVLFLNESSCFYQFVNYVFLCYHEQKLWKIPNIHVYSGVDPGFVVRVSVSRRGVWGPRTQRVQGRALMRGPGG